MIQVSNLELLQAALDKTGDVEGYARTLLSALVETNDALQDMRHLFPDALPEPPAPLKFVPAPETDIDRLAETLRKLPIGNIIAAEFLHILRTDRGVHAQMVEHDAEPTGEKNFQQLLSEALKMVDNPESDAKTLLLSLMDNRKSLHRLRHFVSDDSPPTRKPRRGKSNRFSILNGAS